MSAVTQANVTILRSWEAGSRSGKLVQSARQAQVTLATQGGTTGDIPASLFSLAEIYEVDAFGLNNAGTLTGIPVVLDLLGAGILTCDPTSGALANATGVLTVTVKGRSL